MSEARQSPGTIALAWWLQEIAPRDIPSARGLSARLRRAAPLAVLCEPAVIQLATALGLRPAQADDLVRLASTLVEIRQSGSDTLARRIGGPEPVLSHLRFQRMMRADGAELTDHLRRAIVMADRTCNVAALAADILLWESARPHWCFHYFWAEAPAKTVEEKTE